MQTLTIRNNEDLKNALPVLLPYMPATGDIIVMDSAGQPVANIHRAVLDSVDGDDYVMSQHLQVFRGRTVVLMRVGFHAPLAHVSRAVQMAGADVVHYLSLNSDDVRRVFEQAGKAITREQYVSDQDNQRSLDEAFAKGERVARERA